MAKPSRSLFASSGLWAMFLLVAVLGIQYLAGYLVMRLARESKEADLQNHLADLGGLAQVQLREAALNLSDLALDAALQGGGDLSSPDPQTYRAGLQPIFTHPFDQFMHTARLARVALIAEGGRVLYDTHEPSRTLQTFEYQPIDNENIQAAFKGKANGLPAFRFRDEIFQRYYVPIAAGTESETTGAPPPAGHMVLCLVAGKNFLAQLDGLAQRVRRLGIVITLLIGGAFVLIYSLTQRQRRIEHQATLAGAEAERLASLGTLAAGFAHELRNPLGIIRATTEELLVDIETGGPPSGAADVCRDVIEEVDRMNRLVSQFLNFSRAGAAQKSSNGKTASPRSSRTTQVCTTVETVLTGARAAADRRGVLLQFDAARCDASAHAPIDPAEFKQILLNLVLNAIEASPRESLVRVTLKEITGGIELAVSDEGCGVSAENASRIFDPFFTTKTAGSGLGLPISHQIALSCGGNLELDRTRRSGARFVLTLPRVAPADPSAVSISEITPFPPKLKIAPAKERP